MTKSSLKLTAAAAVMLCAGTLSAAADDYYGDDCHHNNRAAGTILGAIAGGVIGGAVSHGNGGAVVGGVIDCEDRPYAWRTYHTAFEGPVGERYEWEHNGHHGYIITHREYWRGDRLCRDFTVVTWRHGDEYRHDGTACRYEDSDWRFM